MAILDADKEAFCASRRRSRPSPRGANVDGRVIMYADGLTDLMMRAIQETNRRRAHPAGSPNEEHGITPQTAVRAAVRELMEISRAPEAEAPPA